MRSPSLSKAVVAVAPSDAVKVDVQHASFQRLAACGNPSVHALLERQRELAVRTWTDGPAQRTPLPTSTMVIRCALRAPSTPFENRTLAPDDIRTTSSSKGEKVVEFLSPPDKQSSESVHPAAGSIGNPPLDPVTGQALVRFLLLSTLDVIDHFHEPDQRSNVWIVVILIRAVVLWLLLGPVKRQR